MILINIIIIIMPAQMQQLDSMSHGIVSWSVRDISRGTRPVFESVRWGSDSIVVWYRSPHRTLWDPALTGGALPPPGVSDRRHLYKIDTLAGDTVLPIHTPRGCDTLLSFYRVKKTKEMGYLVIHSHTVLNKVLKRIKTVI